jgi:protocatechuate 3,4-dioxygenase alpha subunit
VPAACCPARPTRTEGAARRDSGVYAFETIKPGAVEGRNGRVMAPHINAWIVARGINIGLNTRIYFSDEAEANGNDAVLSLIEWEQRRKTLVAER